MSNVVLHVGLTVTDMARSRRFYEEALGFRYDRELRLSKDQLQPFMKLDPPSSIHAVYLKLGNFTVELMEWEPGARTGAGERVFLETGLTHLAIGVPDVKAVAEKIKAMGGTIFSELETAVMARDPDGQFVELLSMKVQDDLENGRPL
jgi:catechol 2,3-dioxygenase-like lactoylglutathione lyase family enzyme